MFCSAGCRCISLLLVVCAGLFLFPKASLVFPFENYIRKRKYQPDATHTQETGAKQRTVVSGKNEWVTRVTELYFVIFNTTSKVVSMKRAISLIAYTQNGREASSSACPERRLFDVGAQCRSSTISELRSRSSDLVGGDLLSQLGNERAHILQVVL